MPNFISVRLFCRSREAKNTKFCSIYTFVILWWLRPAVENELERTTWTAYCMVCEHLQSVYSVPVLELTDKKYPSWMRLRQSSPVSNCLVPLVRSIRTVVATTFEKAQTICSFCRTAFACLTRKWAIAQRVASPACENATVQSLITCRLAMLLPPSEWLLKTSAVRICAYVHPPTPANLQQRLNFHTVVHQLTRF